MESTPLEVIPSILGHSSPAFTLTTYLHPITELTKPAAAAIHRRLGGAVR
jgi:hypothetical protein